MELISVKRQRETQGIDLSYPIALHSTPSFSLLLTLNLSLVVFFMKRRQTIVPQLHDIESFSFFFVLKIVWIVIFLYCNHFFLNFFACYEFCL